jgi:predicted N-acetyltransferase YhbS
MTGHPQRGYSWVHDISSVDLATLAGAGRALADGLDCAYLADVAVHPDHQGHRLGSEIIRRLVAAAQGHKKIILYANPGTEAFYGKLGFPRVNTAPAIWNGPARAIGAGLLSAQPPT